MSGRDRVLLRSQSGPVAGVSLSSTPSSPLTRIEPALFRVLLQRRLALPLPLSNRTCGCGRPLDAFGHHRAACAREKRVRFGKRRWEGLQRGRGWGGHKPVRLRFGSWSAQCQRQQAAGGCCRRLAIVWRGPTRRGHNPRLCSSGRWRTSAGCC